MHNVRFESPEGPLSIDPENNHCVLTPRIGACRATDVLTSYGIARNRSSQIRTCPPMASQISGWGKAMDSRIRRLYEDLRSTKVVAVYPPGEDRDLLVEQIKRTGCRLRLAIASLAVSE